MLDGMSLERVRRMSRAEYERMAELGMFHDERVELLDGLVVTMSRIGWLHNRVTAWFTERLIRSLDPSYEVRTQGSFAASDWSEPQPDVAVAGKDYSLRENPRELLLVIEVADSSINHDRDDKLPIYAAAGVPEYWIVDLRSMAVEVYTQPNEPGYANVETLRDGDVLRPTRLPGVELAVAAIPR